MELRNCLREAIPENQLAAGLLTQAVASHAAGDYSLAAGLIRQADIPSIAEWTESIWGKASPWLMLRRDVEGNQLVKSERVPERMPSAEIQRQLHERDGFHCRFCGIPVVRNQVRERIQRIPRLVKMG